MEVYTEEPRGSGRTTRDLKALPDGGVYLVADNAMRNVMLRRVHDLGRDGKVHIFTISEVLNGRVRGLTITCWDIDHCLCLNKREWREVSMLQFQVRA
jgi:hypothetical protein